MALLFVALATSELLIPDRVHGTMAIYASRALTTPDYVMMRASSLAIVVIGFLWIPHLVLFTGRGWVSSEGISAYIGNNYPTIWKTALVSVVYFAAYTSIGFLVAAFSKRTTVAAGVYLGIVMLSGATGALVDAGFDVFGLGAVLEHPTYVKNWILGGSSNDLIPRIAGMEPYASLLVIVAMAVAAVLVVVGRYRRAA
jgi:hypothetical protein